MSVSYVEALDAFEARRPHDGRPASAVDAAAPRAQRVDFTFSPNVVMGAVRATDILAFALVGVAVHLLTHGAALEPARASAVQTGFIAMVYAVLANRGGFYDIGAVMQPLSRLDDILVSVGKAAVAFAVAIFAFGVAEEHSLIGVAGFAALSFLAIGGLRYAARGVAAMLARRRVIGSNMAVLGSGPQAQRFLRHFDEVSPYFSVLTGVFAPDDAPKAGICGGRPILGGVDDLVSLARRHKIDDVVIAMPWGDNAKVTEAIEALKELPVNVHLSTDLAGYDLALDPTPGDLAMCPMFAVVRRPISGMSHALKTVEDYVLASLALVALSPLLALVAVAIKIDSPGPVFFMQKRLGFNNRVFEIYKFRSMHHNRPPDDEKFLQQATKGDPRITRVGRFIRATSLDELPQLLNVLNGTMSLVGPRPHALSHNAEYGRMIRGYFARHRVKPGITGWAQVKGLRGETAELSMMEERVRCDVYYADNWSLFLDVKILIMTVLVVLFQKSAY